MEVLAAMQADLASYHDLTDRLRGLLAERDTHRGEEPEMAGTGLAWAKWNLRLREIESLIASAQAERVRCACGVANALLDVEGGLVTVGPKVETAQDRRNRLQRFRRSVAAEKAKRAREGS